MRKFSKVLALVLVVGVAGGAIAAGAQSYILNPSRQVALTDCAAGGTTTAAVPPGKYLLQTFDVDVFLCHAATCAAGGTRFSAGARELVEYTGDPSTTISCRSAGTGDVQLTGAK